MIRQFEPGRIFQLPIERGADLLTEIENAVHALFIDAGVLQFIGAVYEAKIACFNPDTGNYDITEVDEFAEIANGMGTISQKESETVVHAHVVLVGKSGRTYGGHLLKGCKVFVTELTLMDFDGTPQERKLDPDTGLYIW